MKRILALISTVAAAASIATADPAIETEGFETEGYLSFSNIGPYVNAPVYLYYVGSPYKPGSSNYVAQLWYGSQGSAEAELIPLEPGTFFQPTEIRLGYFNGGWRAIPGTVDQTKITVQVRAWNIAAGDTWEQAVATPFGQYGRSALFDVTLRAPPSTPAPLYGLQSFALVPEPTGAALAGMAGMTALARLRRCAKN